MKVFEFFSSLFGPLILLILSGAVAFLVFRYLTFGWIGINDQNDGKAIVREPNGKILLHPELAGIIGMVIVLGMFVICLKLWG